MMPYDSDVFIYCSVIAQGYQREQNPIPNDKHVLTNSRLTYTKSPSIARR